MIETTWGDRPWSEKDEEFARYTADKFIISSWKGSSYDAILWFVDILKERLEYQKKNAPDRFIRETVS